MTKMAVTPIIANIYETLLEKKIIFRTGNTMFLKPCIDHQGLNVYNVNMNDDPGLTMTCFKARPNFVHLRLYGENVKKSFD